MAAGCGLGDTPLGNLVQVKSCSMWFGTSEARNGSAAAVREMSILEAQRQGCMGGLGGESQEAWKNCSEGL